MGAGCHLWVVGLPVTGWVALREEKIWEVLFPKYLPEAHQNEVWLVIESVFHAVDPVVSGSGNWHRTDLASGFNEHRCVMLRYP